jgi:uncharacterized membrane-anchored protein
MTKLLGEIAQARDALGDIKESKNRDAPALAAKLEASLSKIEAAKSKYSELAARHNAGLKGRKLEALSPAPVATFDL